MAAPGYGGPWLWWATIVLETILETVHTAGVYDTCYKRFHRSVTFEEKKKRLMFRWHLHLAIMAVCPHVVTDILRVKKSMNLAEDSPLYILKTCSKSALFLLSSKVHKPNCLILSSYSNFLRSGIIFS